MHEIFVREKRMNTCKKIIAILVTAFLLGNLLFIASASSGIFVHPASATPRTYTASFMPASLIFCIPIPFIKSCKPTPTPGEEPTATPTPTPTSVGEPTATPSPTPGSVSTPIPGPTATRTPLPGATPTPDPSETPVANPPTLAAATSFTLAATSIVGTNAHLDLLPDLLYPVLSFSAVTIEGMTLTHLSLRLSATGTITGSSVSIKTSVFQDLVTALSSFTNKADLLVLVAGGTVGTLTMKNVSLQVDRYVNIENTTMIGLSISQS
jgi:hypothetical protein